MRTLSLADGCYFHQHVNPPANTSLAMAYHHGGKSRKEGEEKTGLADLSEIRALNCLCFGCPRPRERARYARNKCMEGPSSALSALLDGGYRVRAPYARSSLPCGPSRSAGRLLFSLPSLFFLMQQRDAHDIHSLVRPCQGNARVWGTSE